MFIVVTMYKYERIRLMPKSVSEEQNLVVCTAKKERAHTQPQIKTPPYP